MIDKNSDCLLVAFDFSNGEDNAVCVVGKRIFEGIDKSRTDVVNAFKGKEAEDLYKLLTTKKGDKKDV